MIQRLKGVLALLPLLAVLYVGGIAINITACILTLLGLKELYSAFRKKDIKPVEYVGLALSTYIFLNGTLNIPIQFSILIMFVLFILLALLVISNKHSIIDIAVTLFGVFYIAIPFACIVYTYHINSLSPNIVWISFLIAFSTDIFAYLIGKKFGKHKLIPKISPNKTIEGSLGGILGAVLVIGLYCMIAGLNLKISMLTAILGSLLAQIGDLFASAIKRQSQIKDFGNLIPGHGGIIDRFDSILFVAPLILLIATIL